MTEGKFSVDDPRADDVCGLLERHLVFARSHSPPEDAHALGIDGLEDPAVTFFSFRIDGELLAVGALKKLDESHAELKSRDRRPAGICAGTVAVRKSGLHALRAVRRLPSEST